VNGLWSSLGGILVWVGICIIVVDYGCDVVVLFIGCVESREEGYVSLFECFFFLYLLGGGGALVGVVVVDEVCVVLVHDVEVVLFGGGCVVGVGVG